ncbi:ThiF family adenylyltransferase [Pectobacterium versatile]|uniref:ThiF family adenylyltransferase n=1 Tax=Pectobacterium versatile TaxID=2488639 RepID=UPI0032EE8F2E
MDAKSVMGNFRLRQSVGIVVQDDMVEFFKSNVRESVKIKIKFPKFISLLQMFDGKTSLESIIEQFPGLNFEQLDNIATFLNINNVLIRQDCSYLDEFTGEKYRLINTFEDYCYTTSDVLECISGIESSKVMIVGMGAVGSNVATYLAHCGIGSLLLVDHDNVDISNLHRQYFFENDIGEKKSTVLCERLKEISENINVNTICDTIDDDFFQRNILPSDIDLIINCADEPNVDYTSKIISSYCMLHRIPHIVGGGYNLHQTLIGQTIIPFETSCFNCFTIYLDKINNKDLANVKKLHRTKRKLGSYSPLSSMAASLASLDAIKLLSGKKEYLQQASKRVEFNLRTLSFNVQDVPRDPQCACCGGKNEEMAFEGIEKHNLENINEEIIFEGIETHNLKNINANIPINKVTVIYGRSGAGKSSLAFSSIYQLCKDEFDAIENGYLNEGDYKVTHYDRLKPAVALPQRNTNNNPRSTIYSYLNIPQALSSLKTKSNLSIPDYHQLKLNKYENACPHCLGRGDVVQVDEGGLINEHCRLDEKPFLCWRSGELSDYYNQLFLAYCQKNNINIASDFSSLSQEEKHIILYGESDEKITFRCKHKGKIKQRRAFYKGVMLYANNNIGRNQSTSQYGKETICPSCKGSRINPTLARLNVIGLSFDEFLLLPISALCTVLENESSESTLLRVLSSINNIGLGYLNLSRSIPSLSGGELQKLMFSRLLTSNTTGILVVIDEISSQINPVDYPDILSKIRKIAEKNTVVLVEHSQYFIDHADKNIHIGKFAGSAGGEICEYEEIQPLKNMHDRNNISDFHHFEALNKNNIINQSVKFPKEGVTIFSGVSGSGKSSLAKAICEVTESTYISQKLPSYSGRSSVASITELNKPIANYFSQKTDLDSIYFLPNIDKKGNGGGCKSCEGKGIIKYERGFEKDIYITCHECNGMLFDSRSDEVKTVVNGMSIIDIYNAELKDLLNFFNDPKIDHILMTIEILGLSHLKLNRKTQSLSGGEMRRIKLCEILSKKRKSNKLLFIDEPAAGLDPETASKVLSFIYQKSPLFSAIVVIEHRPEAEDYADFKVSIGPGSGEQGGQILAQEEI